jgi:hypothetical protein
MKTEDSNPKQILRAQPRPGSLPKLLLQIPPGNAYVFEVPRIKLRQYRFEIARALEVWKVRESFTIRVLYAVDPKDLAGFCLIRVFRREENV